MRLTDEGPEGLKHIWPHSDGLETENGICLIEDAHDRTLAVHGGNDGDTDVDRTAGALKLDAAVLRKPSLSDVHFRENLQAGYQRGVHSLRGLSLFVQDSVEPVANPH